jgi:hypothetical protein
MSRFTALWLPIIFYTLFAFLNLPGVRSSLSGPVFGILVAAAVLAFAGNQVYSKFPTFDKLENIRNVYKNDTKKYIKDLQKDLSEELEISFRIMVLRQKKCFFSEIDPKRDIHAFGKYWPMPNRKHLIPVYSFGGKSANESDNRVRFTLTQGVSSQAYNDGEVKYDYLEEGDNEGYNLNENQIEKVKDVKSIISHPVIRNKEVFGEEEKVVGVVNIDSKEEVSRLVIENDELRNYVVDRISQAAAKLSPIL